MDRSRIMIADLGTGALGDDRRTTLWTSGAAATAAPNRNEDANERRTYPMKKHTINALTLSRDTLRTLDPREAAQVGGALIPTRFQDTCISCSRCVNHCI
jgi:hypothetical protein